MPTFCHRQLDQLSRAVRTGENKGMCRASVQGWHPVASEWYATSLWGKPWTGASHSLPSRSGQSQGPAQPRSSQLRDAELEGSMCAYVCRPTRVGRDGDCIELNQETPTPTVCSPLPPSAAATTECAGTHPPPHPCPGEEIRLLLPCVCSGDAGRIRVPWGPHSHSPGDHTDGSRFQGMIVP